MVWHPRSLVGTSGLECVLVRHRTLFGCAVRGGDEVLDSRADAMTRGLGVVRARYSRWADEVANLGAAARLRCRRMLFLIIHPGSLRRACRLAPKSRSQPAMENHAGSDWPADHPHG